MTSSHCFVLGTFVLPFLLGTGLGQESNADLLGTMYWTHRDEGIYRAARDGSEMKLLVPIKFADGLAIDTGRGKVFWAIGAGGRDGIQCANLDGSVVQTLVHDLNHTGDLVLDADAGKLYVSVMGDRKITVVNTDGKEAKDLLTGLQSPDELALDLDKHVLYWTCSANGNIQRASLGDLKIQDVVATQSIVFGLAIDAVEHKLYWVDAGRNTINRASLDGSDRQQIVDGVTDADGLAIDRDNRKLYWTEHGNLSQSNLDGSGRETLITGKVSRWSSVVVLPPAE